MRPGCRDPRAARAGRGGRACTTWMVSGQHLGGSAAGARLPQERPGKASAAPVQGDRGTGVRVSFASENDDVNASFVVVLTPRSRPSLVKYRASAREEAPRGRCSLRGHAAPFPSVLFVVWPPSPCSPRRGPRAQAGGALGPRVCTGGLGGCPDRLCGNTARGDLCAGGAPRLRCVKHVHR